MKKVYLLLLMVAAHLSAAAQFTTAGDGTTYTLQTLSALADAGVLQEEAEPIPGYRPIYVMRKSVTIAEGDKFVMTDGVDVLFDNDITFTIEGEADFLLAEGSKFESWIDGAYPTASVCIKSQQDTDVEHCTFNGIGLEVMATGSTNVRHCDFNYHGGATAAALYYITAGATSTIEDCRFGGCRKAAIGSAANASQPLIIKDCTFTQNSVANNNIPQINITAAQPIEITGCTVIGNPDNYMVGGIGISNFMGYDASVLISACTIKDNRYGIGLVGPAANIRIENNTLIDNRYEQNPMNGGSGISLYDPYQMTTAVIAGNHIEGSLWGVTIIGCQDVNLGQPDNAAIDSPGGNVFKDNGNGGQLYDLYNNSTLTVYAQNNTWNVSEQTEEAIEGVIFHKADDASLGEVIYWPAAPTTSIDALPSTHHTSPSTLYTLDGRPVEHPSRGIYIWQGKKVVIPTPAPSRAGGEVK